MYPTFFVTTSNPIKPPLLLLGPFQPVKIAPRNELYLILFCINYATLK